MLLKLENPKIFSDVISIISELVLEVRMKVNKEGLNVVAIDPANVAMVVFKLPAKAFSELSVEKEEVLGVSLESLKAVLRRVKFGSVLTITREENLLKLIIQDKVNREFDLSLIDVEVEEKPVPNLDFSSKIEMNSLDFSEAIEDCSIVADACSFVSNPESFIIKAKGSLNSFQARFSDEANIQSEDASSKYSLEYLQKMIKSSRLADKVAINFSTNYPLKLDFNNDSIELGFILAPRVEAED